MNIVPIGKKKVEMFQRFYRNISKGVDRGLYTSREAIKERAFISKCRDKKRRMPH